VLPSGLQELDGGWHWGSTLNGFAKAAEDAHSGACCHDANGRMGRTRAPIARADRRCRKVVNDRLSKGRRGPVACSLQVFVVRSRPGDAIPEETGPEETGPEETGPEETGLWPERAWCRCATKCRQHASAPGPPALQAHHEINAAR
jgi:hypothetical protein